MDQGESYDLSMKLRTGKFWDPDSLLLALLGRILKKKSEGVHKECFPDEGFF